MIVNVKEFTGALSKVTAMANNEKTIPGVMLDINDDGYMNVCFSAGTKAVIEKISVTLSDSDTIREKVVLPYSKLIDIIGACQPSGSIITDEIEFVFSESTDGTSNIVKVMAEKKLLLSSDTNEDGEETVEKKTVSKFTQSTTWDRPDKNNKFALLNRMNYDSIFNPPDDTQIDVWDSKELKEILSRISTESGRSCYISAQVNSAFVANVAHVTVIPVSEDHITAASFTTALAKSIVDVISKLRGDQDKLNVFVLENKFISIYTDDSTVGIWLEMSKPNPLHISNVSAYTSMKFDKYQITFVKEALHNVVKAALSSGKDQKNIVTFGDSALVDGAKELRITSKDSSASVNNDYTVVCESYIEQEDKIDALQLPVSLKVLDDMLNNCNTPYIGLDICMKDKSRVMRISEIDLEKQLEETGAYRNMNELTNDQGIPLEAILEIREKTLVAKHYAVSQQ